MGLSSDLISQFVKVTKDDTKTKKETITYGTITVDENGTKYVQLDGSTILTPLSSVESAVDVDKDDRVKVLIKNHTVTITGNLSNPSATYIINDTSGGTDKVVDVITKLDIAIADKVSTKELEVEKGRIDVLVAENVTIKDSLNARKAEISTLQAKDVTITEQLTAAEADIETLNTTVLDVEIADIKYANITEALKATNADVHNLESTYAEFEVATAGRLTAAEAVIDDLDATYATISELDAAKGDISSLESDVADIDTLIFGSATGNTIQTSFANAVIAQLGDAQIKSAMIESVSAGKITAGDIITNNVRVKSEDGKLLISDETIQISDDTRVRVQIGKDAANDYSINIWDADGNLMFSKGGITDSAIKKAIIRNDMVSDTANIAAHKLDIDSLFEEINNDGANTIKSTKVYLDEEGQTLDVSFKSLTTDVDNLETKVSSQGTRLSVVEGKIESEIWQQDIDTAKGEMSTQYSALEQDLDGFKTTVSDTYTTKTEFNNLEIGGRNLYKRTADFHSSYWGSYTSLEPYENDPSCKQAVCCNNYVDSSLFLLSTTTELQGFDFSDTSKTWTISAMMKGTADKQMVAVTLDSDRVHWYAKTIPNGSWKKMVWTFTGSKSLVTFRFTSANASAETPIYIAQVKVEEGNKATTWTPAPEDVSEEIETLVSSAETKISQNTTSIMSVANRMTVVENKFDNYSTTTQMNSAIQQKADTIISTVSKSVSDIKIGGRNLLINSSKWDEFTCPVNVTTHNTAYVEVTPGEELTVSYDVKSTDNNSGNVLLLQYFKIGPNNIDNRDSYMWINHAVTTEYVRYSYTFIVPDEILYLKLGLRSANSYANTFRRIKVERGNKATDWTPAPEDMATNQKVDDVDSKINGRNLIIRSESTEDAYYDQSGTFTTNTSSGTAAMTSYIAITPNTKYTFSRSAGGGDFFRFNWYDADKNYISRKAITEISNSQAGTYTWTSPSTAYYILVSYPWDLKSKAMLELGDGATDWSLAPEDMASEEELSETNIRVASAETIIEQLSNSISMLVTDGNGTSLMTQTDTGWTFSTAEIQSTVNRTSESLNTLANEVGDIDSVVSILQEAVADLGTIAEYVKITTYEDEPCIELGEGDSDFKLRITNTRMMFTEGSTTLAYFNNQSFHVKKAVIEEELQQGGFIWKVRSNGNLGLVWKGVT